MSDEPLADIASILVEVMQLERGCTCDYDYRCGNCEQILKVKSLTRQFLAQAQEASDRRRRKGP